MAAHLYWRLNVAAIDGGAALTIAEIELRTSVGGADQTAPTPTTTTTGGTASSTAVYDGSHTAAQAFDGNLATAFMSNATLPAQLRYAHASAVSIASYAVSAISDGWSQYAPTSWTLEYSTDGGSTWSVAHTVAGQPTWATGEKRVFNFTSVGAAADWRLNVSVGGVSNFTCIGELALYTVPYPFSASSGNPDNAFDNSNSTNWVAITNQTTGWISYQFASAQDIVEHAVTAPSATMTNAPKNYSIQWSDDGLNWTSAAIVQSQTGWTSNEKRVFTHSSWPVAIGVGVLSPAYLAMNQQAVPSATVNAVLRADQLGGKVYTGPNKTISGTVKENGTPVARKVRAYHRATGDVLGETTSDATTGAFSINALGHTDNCYVVALDDLTLLPDFNALIFDLVLPL